MSKKMTPLKALEQLKYYNTFANDDFDMTKELDIIETALKDYELMKQTKIIVADKKISDEDLEKLKNQRMFVSNLEKCEIKPLFNEETQKKLKAIEVIKKYFTYDFDEFYASPKWYKDYKKYEKLLSEMFDE